jgi:hypothetical protein
MAEAVVTAPAGGKESPERVVPMGREPALPIRPLPPPINWLHILGPGMVLTALGVGLGETFMWPRLVVVFGENIRILFLLGVTIQLFVMLEMARWTLATGESIFFGAARIHRAVMWAFWLVAILVYIWPGHIGLGAQSLSIVMGNTVPWPWLATAGIVLIALVLTFAPVAYSAVETILSILIGILVIGSAIVAALVAQPGEFWRTVTGMFLLGSWLPDAPNPFSKEWFPIIVGSAAFAGPSGMQQMWFTLYLRDKGAGMGHYAGRITSWLTGEEESMPSRGYTFDPRDPEEQAKWRGWLAWARFDAIVLFWGITMLTTMIFTTLALASIRIDPAAQDLIQQGQQAQALRAMSAAFAAAGGPLLGALFYISMAIVGWKMSFGIFDAFSRGQADMTWYFMPKAQRWSMSHWYYFFLYLVCILGITVIWINQGRPATFLLDILAFLSPFIMGGYCLVLLWTNNRFLPKEIRPNPLVSLIVALGVVLYWGGLFASLLLFRAIPSG